MSKFEYSKSAIGMTTTVTASFGDEQDVEAIRDAIKQRIVLALVDKFVEKHGEEVLATIDLETIKRKTNDKVTVAAIKELVK